MAERVTGCPERGDLGEWERMGPPLALAARRGDAGSPAIRKTRTRIGLSASIRISTGDIWNCSRKVETFEG